MSVNRKHFLLLLIFLGTIICSCNTPPQKNVTKHYSEEMLQAFAKICDQQKNRDTGIYLLDSLYGTFPAISAADKYRFYDFKRQLFEFIRFGDRSYDTAIVYLDSMIAVVEDNKLEKEMSQEYLKAFNIRSDYYSRRKRYSEAVRDLNHCKQLNKEAGDSCLMADNSRTLSMIAIKQSDFPLAAAHLNEALELGMNCTKNWEQLVRMQRNLDDMGFIYTNMKKYDSALYYHFKAADFVQKNLYNKDTLFSCDALTNIYGNIAMVYDAKEKYKEAELYFKKAMAIQKDFVKNNFEIAKLELFLGKVFLKMGRINEAYALSEKVVLHEKEFDNYFKVELYLLKYNLAKLLKKQIETANYEKKYWLARDTVNQGRIAVLKANPFIEYEQLDKKYQVELLKKENQNQQNKTKAVITIGILISLLAIISSFLLWRLRIVMKKRSILYKELKKTTEEKEIAEKQSRESELFAQEMRLQMEFNEAIIHQRRKISDDMHDELSSSLAALKFFAEDVKGRAIGTAAADSLSDLTDEITTVYQNARSYMHSLKTNNWETRFSLIGFLKEIQQKFSEKGLMDVKLELDENSIKSRLTTHQHDHLYHIIRESISNIIKHASAKEILVSVLFTVDNCTFSISDNGKGFRKEDITYGIGLQSIKNRFNDLGGSVRIESFPTGTKILGTFPVY